MNRKKNEIFVLNEAEEKTKNKKISEIVLVFLILAGILLFLKDFSYSQGCLITAFVTGGVVILMYWAAERSEKDAGRIKMLLYVVWIAVFLGTITLNTQGLFYLADCFLGMWNSRFGTEALLFAVGSRAGAGSLILWGLLSAAMVSFIFSQLKRNKLYGILLLMLPAAACGLILESSDMWLAAVLSLAGFFGIFIVYSTKGKNFGLGGLTVIGGIAVTAGLIGLAAGGYRQSAGIEQWKAELEANMEKLRYGTDSLPQGDLKKEPQLLNDEKETLKISMNQPQELYLRGFVGGSYQGMNWRELPQSAYAGEYEGMLRWLKQNDFSPLSQYAAYDKLDSEVSGKTASYTRVTVENKGAYRKYVYLPSVAQAWKGSGDHKDWNVESKSFFGASKYEFQVPEGKATADSTVPGSWSGNPSRKDQEKYVNAEAVYHSFVLDSYMDVEDTLKEKILQDFFSEDKTLAEMDFDELTTRIRQVLRNKIRYREIPEEMPENEDMVSWLLEGGKEGNSVAFASAAVMAYRAAGYPARYTEGYHLSSTDAQAAADEGKKELVLTTKNAHAWAEVYISGIGWMPVEVVPGMYTETYTDKLIEGKPSYRVNGVQDESGADTTEEGTGGGIGKEERKTAGKPVWKVIPAVSIMILYLFFGIYLLLELQRAVRREIKKRKKQNSASWGKLVEWYAAEIEKLIILCGIKEDFSDPEALYDRIEEVLPEISRKECERFSFLVQKHRFGGIDLQPYELRVLDGITEKCSHSLYGKQKLFGKLKLRYIYIL